MILSVERYVGRIESYIKLLVKVLHEFSKSLRTCDRNVESLNILCNWSVVFIYVGVQEGYM